MSLELNEEFVIKTEPMEEHDCVSDAINDIVIKKEACEIQDNEFERSGTSGDCKTLSGNESYETDTKIYVNHVETRREVATTSLLTNSISDNSHTCEICNKKFSLRCKHIQHLRSMHRVDNLIPCLICNKTFELQLQLSVHLLSHSEKLHPLLISEKVDSSTFICKICGITQHSIAKFLLHIKSVHLGLREYKCNVCSRYFIHKMGLTRHFISQHTEFEHFTCTICSYSTSQDNNLKTHFLNKHKLDEDSVASLLPAMRNCKKSFTCKVCNAVFEYGTFVSHIGSVHISLDRIKCPVCYRIFTCIVTLIGHLHAHGGTKQEQDIELESAGTSFDCSTLSCNETDIKIEVVPVEIGGEVATTPMLKKCISGDSFACEVCSKSFNVRSSLVQHLRKGHKVCNLISCFVCNKTFERYDLMVHLLSHAEILLPLFRNEKKDFSTCTYCCKVCGATKNSNFNVIQHIKSVHLGLKKFKCNICSTYLTDKMGIISHFISQHSKFTPFTCVVCGHNFLHKKFLQRHMINKHKLDENSVASLLLAKSDCRKTYTCKVCNVEIKSRIDFSQHVSKVHVCLDKIKCPACHIEFTCIANLIIHLHAHSSTKQEQRIGFESSGTSGNSKTLSKNTDVETDVDPVEIGREVATTSLLTNSVSVNSHTCKICRKRFKVRGNLIQHLKKSHMVVEPLIKRFTNCFVCNEIFSKQCDLVNHLLSHAEILHPLFSSEKKDSFTFACKICGIEENSNIKVQNHVKSVHLGLREYKCKLCNTYFKLKSQLKNHFVLKHCSFQPFTCNICSSKCSNITRLRMHIISEHKVDENSVVGLLPSRSLCESSLDCKVCDVEFKSRGDFNQHISDIHDGLDDIKCPVCPKNFTCIVKLIDHLHSHSDSDQPFSCGMCEERFSTENARSTHVVNFHNKSPDGSSGSFSNECDKCKKVVTSTDQLKKNIVELHNSNSISCFRCYKCDMFGSYDHLKEHNYCSYPSEDSSVICSVCKETFSSVQSLKIHSANMHENTFETSQFDNTGLLVSPNTKIGIVRCEICKRDFANPTSLKNHLNKIHKNNQNQTSLQQNRRERQKVSQREHRTAEYLKNRFGSSPVKPQLQQAMEGRKVRPDYKSTGNDQADIWITKVKPCCVLLDRGEVTRYLARLDKREEGTVESSPIENLPSPFATPPVRVYPSHPCRRAGVMSDRLLSAATSNVGLVCNNIGPRAIVEPKQLCVVNSGNGEVSSNNCIQNANFASQKLGNFEEMYIQSEPIFSEVNDCLDPLSCL